MLWILDTDCLSLFQTGNAQLVIPNQPIVAAYPSPHPQPFSLGRREQDSKSLSRAGEGFRVRADDCRQSLIWY
jgi:hypothetical protein